MRILQEKIAQEQHRTQVPIAMRQCPHPGFKHRVKTVYTILKESWLGIGNVRNEYSIFPGQSECSNYHILRADQTGQNLTEKLTEIAEELGALPKEAVDDLESNKRRKGNLLFKLTQCILLLLLPASMVVTGHVSNASYNVSFALSSFEERFLGSE